MGGSSQAGLPFTDADLPSTPSHCVKRQMTALQIVRDLWHGTERLRDKGAEYLPKSPAEDAQHYADRLSRAVFFNAFRRTVSGLTGLVFSRDPHLGEDVPPQIAGSDEMPGHWENIDNAGTHGDVFLREQLQDALAAGHNAIFVEYPATGGTQNAAAEMHGEIRPYWVQIKKDNIVSWRTMVENGKPVLTQLVLKECMMEPSGQFGEEEVTRYRVFTRSPEGVVGFRLLRVTDGKSVIEEGSGTYPTQDEIPIAEVPTSGKRSLFESDPPLMDLAFLNIAHYQERSDYAWSKHLTCSPTLGLFGFEATDAQGQPVKIAVGGNAMIRTSSAEARAEYIEPSGGALAEVRQSLEELKSEMGSLGLAMLAPQKRSAETAEAKRLDKQTTDSDLGVAARALQDATERALYFHARYLKLSDGGSIEINRNFESAVMEPEVMQAYVTLARELGLPLRVVLQELKQGGRISADTDLDDLESEMMANALAQEDAKRLAEEERLEVELARAKMGGNATGEGGGMKPPSGMPKDMAA